MTRKGKFPTRRNDMTRIYENNVDVTRPLVPIYDVTSVIFPFSGDGPICSCHECDSRRRSSFLMLICGTAPGPGLWNVVNEVNCYYTVGNLMPRVYMISRRVSKRRVDCVLSVFEDSTKQGKEIEYIRRLKSEAEPKDISDLQKVLGIKAKEYFYRSILQTERMLIYVRHF